MVKYIKRKIDKKFLQSLDNDLWVDNIKDAVTLSYRECEMVKQELFKTYNSDEIIEMINFQKLKPISEEEKQEILSILKK